MKRCQINLSWQKTLKFQPIEYQKGVWGQKSPIHLLICTFLLLSWGNDDTEQLIAILKEYNVPATFFVVGAWVDKYPESVKALASAGHQIQNHSNTHPHMPQLSRVQMQNEIASCNEKIKAITGVEPTLLRPPYGDYDNALIETMNALKMYTIQWDVETLATKVIV